MCACRASSAGFADAELSESYDKGAVGTRKNLATASSAFIEAAARGCLGGCSPSSSGHAFSGGLAGRTYDVEDARDLARSWDDVVREMVYGRLLDELFDHATKTADIEAHSPAIVAAVDCIIIQYGCPIFCFPLRVSNNRFRLSHRDGTCCTALGWPVSCIRYASCPADGPYIIKLLESAHRLVPYSLVRQTLRVSNAATMMAAMMRLLLAKLGVGGMTNWIGLTKNADEGMNLLQRCVGPVAPKERRPRGAFANMTGGPPGSYLPFWPGTGLIFGERQSRPRRRERATQEHFAAIRQHMARFRQEHEQVRRQSVEGQRSIIAAIFDSVNADLAKDLSESDHAECGNYYSALLSVRDREQITAVLCRQSPDLVTQALREVTAALEPLIPPVARQNRPDRASQRRRELHWRVHSRRKGEWPGHERDNAATDRGELCPPAPSKPPSAVQVAAQSRQPDAGNPRHVPQLGRRGHQGVPQPGHQHRYRPWK